MLLASIRKRRRVLQKPMDRAALGSRLFRKHWPMLQRAGCKPALHLVALYQMDREHVARLFP
jgi:hypothetical protein